jgi:hypothetical protein
MPNYIIKEIVSGGQTGVDRAALDVAKAFNILYGGWCPQGRWAEDAPIPDHYLNLQETPSSDPKQRTEWNVRDSDATLIIVNSVPTGGTLYTIEMAQKHKKPCLIFDLSKEQKIEDIVIWIKKNIIHKLNVAGPRESQREGMYKLAYGVLSRLARIVKSGRN